MDELRWMTIIHGVINTWSEAIWRRSIQPRRSLTMWKAIHNLLPTEKLLQRKRVAFAVHLRKILISTYSFFDAILRILSGHAWRPPLI